MICSYINITLIYVTMESEFNMVMKRGPNFRSATIALKSLN